MHKEKINLKFHMHGNFFQPSLYYSHQKLVLPVSTIFILLLVYALMHMELRALAQPAATGA